MKPKIGVAASPKKNIKNYIQALVHSGAEPIVLSHDKKADQDISELDGLLLTGGGDIPPYFWGDKTDISDLASMELNERRAQFEIPLVRVFHKNGKPVLGICLGLQMINVALGGTLYQDIRLPHCAALHRKTKAGHSSYHEIEVMKGSKISQILPSRLTVNSRHHQAIKDLSPDLKVTARAIDGVIEAVESKGPSWILGVQWHPEDLYDKDEHQKALFLNFVEECKG